MAPYSLQKILKIDKSDPIPEEMAICRNKNLHVTYTATMKHLKIGGKSDVMAVSMATMTFQYGGYLSFKRMLPKNGFCDSHLSF